MRSLSLAVLSLALLLNGCAVNLVRVEEKFNLTAAWQSYDRVIVRTVNGRVELKSGGTGQEATISGVKRAAGATLADAQKNLEELTITATADANDSRALLVSLDYPEALRHRNIGASFVIQTPAPCAADVNTGNGEIVAEQLKGEIVLRTSNGGVRAIDIDGNVKIDTSNGDVEARDVTGGVHADTSNGSVRLTQVGGGATVDSSNGELVFTGVRGAVHGSSSNGGITLEGVPGADDSIELDTSNGEITLKVPPVTKGHLRLVTSNGRIHTSLGAMALHNSHIGKSRLEADMNGGGAGKLHAETSNGSITMFCQ